MIELSGPDSGDGNGDGIDDDRQTNVATISDSPQIDYLTLALPQTGSCSQINSFIAVDETSLADQDSFYLYPRGLNEFEIACTGSVDIAIYYHGTDSLSTYTYRKFGPIVP